MTSHHQMAIGLGDYWQIRDHICMASASNIGYWSFGTLRGVIQRRVIKRYTDKAIMYTLTCSYLD